jgi:hypothetical protein
MFIKNVFFAYVTDNVAITSKNLAINFILADWLCHLWGWDRGEIHKEEKRG